MEICCRQGQVDGYPENTLQGGKRAKEFGYNRLRVSVVWTSDGVPICAHLDKVAGSTLRTKDGEQVTDESLYLSNMTYEDIATNYDAGIYKGDNFKGIYVPTLESMIKQCKRLNQTLVIEYKAGYTSARMQALLETLAKYAMTDKSTYSTTHSEQIAEVGSMTYKIPCYLIAHLSLEQVNLAIQSGAVALSFFSDDTYSLEAVLRARENGLALRTGSFSTIAAAETFLEWCDGFEFYNIKNPVRALITA
jgi:glycerophosphoryl diester phosphodiesterase